MTERAMLDASMLVHRVPLARMRALAEVKPDALSGLVVSDAFVRLVTSLAGELEDNFGVRLFSQQFRVPRGMIDLDSARAFLGSAAFREYVRPYRRESVREIPPMYRAFLDTTGNEWATQILFEEWEYLMNHSWLFSKTRAVYDHIVNAGTNALYVTKKKLESAVRATKAAAQEAGDSIVKGSDRLVARTIKKPLDKKISPNDRVRALAKWVAVGGSAATSLMVPIAGATVSVATGIFLLYDP